jgi:hypothetical protein
VRRQAISKQFKIPNDIQKESVRLLPNDQILEAAYFSHN